MNLKKINKKLGSKEAKIRYSIHSLYINPDSLIHCDHCKNKLGIFHMLKKAFFKKPGEKYFVKCKSCGNINFRIKGEIGKQIDKTWLEDGF